ncbi:MAG: ABC transporter ATP-binding protein/permease [Anaerolineales bacterium]|nr:ABC transporter ATP-binding protein/permease [Anaerolineales bacterium]
MLRLLWRAYGYLRPYSRTVVLTYLCVFAILGLNLTVPQFIRWIIDRGIAQDNLTLLGLSVVALLGITLVRGIFSYFEGTLSERASQHVAYDLRNAIQNKLTVLSFSFHDQSETGELLSRAIQDVERIRFLTGRAAVRIVDGGLMLVGTALVLIWMNPRLGALVVLTMPLLVLQAVRFGSRYRPLSLKLQRQIAALTTVIEQNLRGSRVVKAFAQEEAEIARFRDQNETWFRLSRQAAWMESFIGQLLLQMLANMGMVFIIWYGGKLAIEGQLTLGELVAFTTYLGQLIDPVRRLGMILPVFIIAGSAAERIFEILDAAPDVKDEPGARPLPLVQGWVSFENVSFGYHLPGLSSLSRVLEGITFEANPGQVIALLGPTGSGKSSIISLVPRFYDPTGGRITVDGIDLRQVTIASLRSQIGIVLQESTLFATTLRENIAFGRPQASLEEITSAAQAAQIHDFIAGLPQGYDTPVGERGVTLSGGQKQRVAIARALLLDPRILILDDATASVDTETEHYIQAAFEKLMQGRTTFVIAHRLSTVRRADMILVLEKGRIAARGTHAELLQTSDLYRSIYERQLRPQEIQIPAGGPT